MAFNNSPHGLVELRCTGCGSSIGFHPYQGFKTVSSCQNCLLPDGFERPKEWPEEGKFLGRDVGTTIEDFKDIPPAIKTESSKPTKEEEPAVEEQKVEKKKPRKRSWMNRKSEN